MGLSESGLQLAALAIACAFALWVAAGSAVAIVRPSKARGWIARFATSHVINIAEQAWRGLAGAALVLRAPEALWTEAFHIAGWVLIASSAALLVVPLRWHAGYAVWWSRNLPLAAVRAAGVAGVVLAVALVAGAFG